MSRPVLLLEADGLHFGQEAVAEEAHFLEPCVGQQDEDAVLDDVPQQVTGTGATTDQLDDRVQDLLARLLAVHGRDRAQSIGTQAEAAHGVAVALGSFELHVHQGANLGGREQGAR